jgi:hypothetical protein
MTARVRRVGVVVGDHFPCAGVERDARAVAVTQNI